jgi:hypothetical protein
MSKLNDNETTAFVTTILQERNEALYAAIEQLAYDTMEAVGVPETDNDHDVHIDFMAGLMAKLVHRFTEDSWADVQFGDNIDATLEVKIG